MTQADYEKLSKPTVVRASGLDDIAKTLSRTEQQLCTRLKLTEIPGKHNQTVPVFLTQDVIKGIVSDMSDQEDDDDEFVCVCPLSEKAAHFLAFLLAVLIQNAILKTYTARIDIIRLTENNVLKTEELVNVNVAYN